MSDNLKRVTATEKKPISLACAPKDGDATLESRLTDELVIALVGPVGSGVSTTAGILKRILEDEYNYEADLITVSELIEKSADLLKSTTLSKENEAVRVRNLQETGDLLRKTFTSAYLAKKCVELITTHRLEENGYEVTEDGIRVPLPRRRAHIIDSLKNPAEQKLLRDVYGDVFWLLGVFAPEEVRKKRLLNKGVPKERLDEIICHDEKEDEKHGQNVRDTIDEADFFVRNDGANDERLKKTIGGFLEILFNVSVHTPTVDEMSMYSAMAAAARSACLSRQVGAAIYSSKGELIGLGWNDVPKHSGGLYTSEDGDDDNRCFKWGKKECHNFAKKDKLYESIANVLKSEKLLASSVSGEEIEKVLATTDIRNLIEYCRAVHAEMQAILSVARTGNSGLEGSTMYVTTFPCHNCARHIVASGIARVIYIEPYPKSLALELHSDTITTDARDAENRVLCLQYEGFAPKRIDRFFGHGIDRKAEGKIIERSKKSAKPVFPPPLDAFANRELLVVRDLEKQEQKGEKREQQK
jgi:deoxycytidylate deaminase